MTTKRVRRTPPVVAVKITGREPDLSIEEVARLLNVSTRTARRRAHTGQIPAVREGGLLRFPAASVANYLNARRAANT